MFETETCTLTDHWTKQIIGPNVWSLMFGNLSRTEIWSLSKCTSHITSDHWTKCLVSDVWKDQISKHQRPNIWSNDLMWCETCTLKETKFPCGKGYVGQIWPTQNFKLCTIFWNYAIIRMHICRNPRTRVIFIGIYVCVYMCIYIYMFIYTYIVFNESK